MGWMKGDWVLRGSELRISRSKTEHKGHEFGGFNQEGS